SMALGMVDQNAAHQLRGYREEVSAVLPLHLTLFDQPHISLINERGCLQSVIRAFAPHVAASEAAQLSLDQWNQPVECRPVSIPPLDTQLGYIVWRGSGHNPPRIR